MQSIFFGHGSPMNAIEENRYTQSWKQIGEGLHPRAILFISAHWMTQGVTRVTLNPSPSMIYDFSGFPEELYELEYPASSLPEVARELIAHLQEHAIHAEADQERGLDHGVWSVLKHVFPRANIPVICISLDMTKDICWYLELGSILSRFQEEGIVLMGSGNIVHNLRLLRLNDPEYVFPWARTFEKDLLDVIGNGSDDDIVALMT
jgi:4,5-DOPA dioxygenase extradiol